MGNVNSREQRRIQKKENRESRKIRREKHDAQRSELTSPHGDDLSRLRPGLSGEASLIVAEEHTAPRVGSGAIHVLATPVMINLSRPPP